MKKTLLSQIKKNRDRIQDDKKKEDFEMIISVEELLWQKRKSVITLPKPGSAVILLVSGGLDSITAWARLLKDFKLDVYPVHILTGQPRNVYEKAAVEHYSQLFKTQFPKHFHEPLFISQHTTPPEIREQYRSDLSNWVHPNIIKRNKKKGEPVVYLTRQYTFPAFLPFQAVTAAQYLELKEDVTIRTIILCTLPSDAEYNASQSLTSNRATMEAVCAYTNDYTWQVFSIAYEPALDFYWQKKDFIVWAEKNTLDLSRTYSCFRGTEFNCGECLACVVRKKQFKESGVADTTRYVVPRISILNQVQSKLKRFSKKIVAIKEPAPVIVKFKDYY